MPIRHPPLRLVSIVPLNGLRQVPRSASHAGWGVIAAATAATRASAHCGKYTGVRALCRLEC